jgi:hypothetical protein
MIKKLEVSEDQKWRFNVEVSAFGTAVSQQRTPV